MDSYFTNFDANIARIHKIIQNGLSKTDKTNQLYIKLLVFDLFKYQNHYLTLQTASL